MAWLPDGAEVVTPTPSTTSYAWWPADVDAWPERGRRAAAADRGARRLRMTQRSPSARLRAASFAHSTSTSALLLCAFALGKPEPATFILGLAHGLLWIGMSLALHRRRPARA